MEDLGLSEYRRGLQTVAAATLTANQSDHPGEKIPGHESRKFDVEQGTVGFIFLVFMTCIDSLVPNLTEREGAPGAP